MQSQCAEGLPCCLPVDCGKQRLVIQCTHPTQALTYFPPEDKPLLGLLCRWTVAFR